MINASIPYIEKLQTEDFLRISEYIEEHYGIQLPPSKMKMVEARLQKRLKAQGLTSYSEYFEFAFSPDGRQEYTHMVDLITTNKTEFFRESAHFDFLNSDAFPEIIRKKSPGGQIKIWSAAASTGEEVYSILISLEEYFFKTFKSHPYHILGTDLSIQVLKKAVAGIYDEDRIAGLPMNIKKRYFLRGTSSEVPKARIKPVLLNSVEYKQLNLLKSFSNIDADFDIIFCRNVLIYFNREVQHTVISKLIEHIKPGGYLFIGHSESLTNMQLPLKQVRPTIYKKLA